jgi:UDP-4-amino-4,6-dideoxy-N-acetyl-beta-L-altrosamine transaminase
MNIPYNLPSIGNEEIEEVVKTLKSNWLTMGPKTFELEKMVADYVGAKYAVAVNSCTAGLHLSLLAKGIGPGDEVITTPYTFAATGNTIVHSGAKPVFVDVRKEDFNLDPNLIEAAITEKTKAIIPVHYSGYPCDMDAIMKIAKKHNLVVIEDAAHAIGAKYKDKMIGSIGDTTSFSFYVTKNITTGEGGIITTNDELLANKMKMLRLHGISKDAWNRYSDKGSWYYEIEDCGWKYNLTDIAASIGIHQMKRLDGFNERRRQLAKIYNEELSKIKGITLPANINDKDYIFHLYPILLESYDRSKFIDELKKKGIGTSVHFIPLHLHPFYQKTFGFKKGDFPVTESIYEKEVSLPLYPSMTEEQIHYVIDCIKELFKGN